MINPRQVKILIVDDGREIRELLSARFTIFGFQTRTANSGDEAWAILQQDPQIKIIITDLRMAGGDGVELIKKCKLVHHEFPKIYVITGAGKYSPEAAMDTGAEGLINKPFDSRTLLNTIRTSLLTPQERLRHPPYVVPKISLSASFTDVGAAEAAEAFRLGRGGFYLKTEASPDLESPVAIDIQAGSVALLGTGVVKWRRSAGKDQAHFVGVELVHLSKESCATYVKWLGDNKIAAFIPSPQSATSVPSTAKLHSTG